jgi:DNA-binding MltR family transcriptional regulator
MTEMSYTLSYTQNKAESLLKNSFPVSDVQLTYNSTYGYGSTPNDFSMGTSDLIDLKNELFNEYDELWKELATH